VNKNRPKVKQHKDAHPLHLAMTLQSRAIRYKAHPKFIARLADRVQDELEKGRVIMARISETDWLKSMTTDCE